jgi:PAS domain S-box-containing protein
MPTIDGQPDTAHPQAVGEPPRMPEADPSTNGQSRGQRTGRPQGSPRTEVGGRPSAQKRHRLSWRAFAAATASRRNGDDAVSASAPLIASLLATLGVSTACVPIIAWSARGGHAAMTVAVAGVCLAAQAGFGLRAVKTVTRAQSARADTEREAAANHNQLQKLVDNTSSIIYMKRVDNGRYLLVNREWERLFGVTRDHVVNLTDHGVFPADLAEQLRTNDLGVARAGKTVQYEETAGSTDGLRTYISVKFPVLDGAGTPYAVCGISTDITDRKRAEDEVKRLNTSLETRVRERTAELEASTRELDAFAYSVSHDLRAPLRSLHGFSQALLEDYADALDEAGRDHLRRLQRNVQRMGRMIDDLLNLSRATRVDLDRHQVDISAMARDIFAEFRATDPQRKVTITIDGDLHAYGDQALVRIALHNLLANAWKFTAKRATATIDVGRTRDGDEEVFYVRDNGAGFDMKYAGKLFTAFQRLHATADFEGTGIGLAIVGRVVRRHGGRIFAQAAVDSGATFYFNLASRAETPE